MYRAGNIQVRIALNLRNRLRGLLRASGAKKISSAINLIGCDVAVLKARLESMFRDGMSWENYGSFWHIDHKKPCAKFDLSNAVAQRDCFHFSNLQPLLSLENLKKGRRW
jgi:hypothetical protein